ncbi:hypothetical protein [Mangrovibacterium marinum]|uniref:Lipoprotein n=1 Tax=Mangrovibacterium marinum TaxID=1639118 RepID=A0A2T5C3D6_9BACT|nr:hypothetical protein [Mangrovibacterium marinum]PTN09256.1 hypothetical protein C8N47_10596 [Mangrovibacterium marinum]
MKKSLLLIAGLLFFAIACNEPYEYLDEAQEKSASTKTYQWKAETACFMPLICDGEEIDILEGNLMAHYRWHVQKGEYKWIILNFSGELTSEATGETFEILEVDKIEFQDGAYGQYDLMWNVRGDKGSHYIGSGYVDLVTWEVIAEKTVCPPSNN